ncbi:MAG: TIGR03960 family B12-binding radical SAM protein [Dehalococcoidales bacterium]|nr:TIGR03960 family B12-binding radical SAM protein [Dehalococcoidales bacterium]
MIESQKDILDRILHRVAKPARYTGGEWNCIIKDWDKTGIKVALSYPDTYEIGMSNIALPILYELLNAQPDVLAERVFAPWVDMEERMRRHGIPLFSLETKHPLREFDIIGFSLGYELNYTNVLNMLDQAGIPVLAAERGEKDPLVIAGGTCSLNPEPMSDFIDLFVIGDGEEVTLELLDCFRSWRQSRKDFLQHAAAIPGVYVPSLYTVEYQPDGLIKGITPIEGASPVVKRRIIAKLPPPVTRPVVPYVEAVHDRGAIEVQRGCSCGCRFCQAGMIYRPVRERPHDEVLQAAGELISNCGYDEVSLVSLNTTDYAGVDKLVTSLTHEYPNLAISLPSLRVDSFSVNLMSSLPSRSKTGLTFAPEAGSQRLRQVINKNVTESRLIETARTAFERGWRGLKLYFMLGLPWETMDDVEGIAQLVDKVRLAGRDVGKKPNIRVSASTFVPKPHTPFQRVDQLNEAELHNRHDYLRRRMPKRGVGLSYPDTKVSLLEAAISRGDRRVGKVIYGAWKLGCSFDAWSERFNYDGWLRAFAEAGLNPDFYARRERPLDEVLPWSHIDAGVTPGFLKREYERAQKGETTADCRYESCSACGLQKEAPCQEKLKGL